MYIMEIPKGDKMTLIYQGQQYIAMDDGFGGLKLRHKIFPVVAR